MANIRNSSIELLRILSMFFVMLLHFNNHGANVDLLKFSGDVTLQNAIGHFIESFAIVAVNCFVLISGLYGIKFKIQSLLRLYLQCLFCGLVAYFTYCIYANISLNVIDLAYQICAFSQTELWFVSCYVILYFLAPLLNIAISRMTKKEFIYILGILSFVEFYFGYIQCYISGSSVFHFVYLYLIGRYIGIHLVDAKFIHLRKSRNLYLYMYIIISLCIFGMALFVQYTGFDYSCLRPYSYNSWFVVASSIALLLLFKSFEFSNKLINLCASSVFAAYLLQESKWFGYKILYPYIEDFFIHIDSLLLIYIYLFIYALSFLLFSIFIDKILGKLLYTPIIGLYSQIEQKYSPKIRHRLLILKNFKI